MIARRFALLVIAVVFGFTPTLTAAQDSIPRRYSAAQFYQTTTYKLPRGASLAIAPDGRSVLASSDRSGTFNAYALPLDGGTARALTDSATNATYADSWFPDGKRLLYTADTGGNELSHVFVREADGQVRDLTPGEKVKAIVAGWSGDRRSLWVLTNARDESSFDLYAVDPETYARRMIYRNPGMGLLAVSPDGRWVALVKQTSNADSDIYLADLVSGGAPKLITDHEGNVSHTPFAFTPDSKALIYATDAHGEFIQAWRHDIEGGADEVVVAADWDVSDLGFSRSGRYRYVTLNADGRTTLDVIDTRTGRAVTMRGLPAGNVEDVRFDEEERRMLLAVSSDTSPTDIYVVDLAGGAATRLTRALNPEIRESDLVEAKPVRFRAPDGVEIPALVYRPKGASEGRKVPALVWIHGGPGIGGQSRRGYLPLLQHLVNHGYAVLAVNNRGSDGYGKTFLALDDRRHGEDDLDDVVAAADWLRRQPWVEPRAIAVAGGSYGGYLATAAMAFRPTAFQAGISAYGPTNWLRTLTDVPAWWGSERQSIYAEMGDPATDAERLRRTSPYFHAGSIRRPMLILQGAKDPRVLKTESDAMVAALKANAVPVEYVVFSDEGHGFRRRENRIAASEAYLGFLGRFLANNPH
ncbi:MULTISPECIES: S9 family peptidase [unclassified Novosphingobium]|uniref:S9 family peptidase n=1 Tax=unclassified Novosphingobium TaxID=2644732 RepID=UPI00146E4980|nr:MULTISPECIES: S9 family peptidase [unclassified Novosphingobium]NMN03781.1 dipeptidyl aminopeptidase/acylaminoacyl peptidase [Novosphingobium sp. SG919]NMN86229.1 dipeptidyl aminopeptidase/acylaminoacyl peptidase [Novosphingobium sp. SG916]